MIGFVDKLFGIDDHTLVASLADQIFSLVCFHPEADFPVVLHVRDSGDDADHSA